MKEYKQAAIKNYIASNGQPSNSDGQLLIEVLISALVLLIITSGIVASVIVSVRNAAYAKQRTLGTYYAQRELELAKQRIKENWCFPGTAGLAGITVPCDPSGSLNRYPISGTLAADYPEMGGLTLNVHCYPDASVADLNNNCTAVTLRVTALWYRGGPNTESQVSLSTIIVKENR